MTPISDAAQQGREIVELYSRTWGPSVQAFLAHHDTLEQQIAVLKTAAKRLRYNIIGCTGPDSYLRTVLAEQDAALAKAGISLDPLRQ